MLNNYKFNIIDSTLLKNDDFKALADLTQLAFKEREDDNLHMMPNHITKNGIKKISKNAYFVFAIDTNSQQIDAYLLFDIQKNHKNAHFADIKIIATHPDKKRCGLANTLFLNFEQFISSKNCEYITSDTGDKVFSSIRWHKKMGFYIAGYTHFWHTNYYSLKFRKDLGHSQNALSRLSKRFLSWCKCRLTWTPNGQYTITKRLYLHFFSKQITNNNRTLLNLRQIQQISLNLLDEFTKFCQEHNLRYLLCYGSLLGAIRHNAFIPWDDDIDVTMPLPDYEKLLKEFPHDNNNEHIELRTGKQKGIAIPHAMLVDNRTQTFITSRDQEHSRPIAIDIFPAYPLSDNETIAQKQILDIWHCTRKCYRTHNIKRKNPLKYLYLLITANKTLTKNLAIINQILHLHDWGSTSKIRFFSLDEKDTLALPADCFDNYELAKFENNLYRIPKNYHTHLTELYNDYMTPPPLNMRSAVFSECYWISSQPIPTITLKQLDSDIS